MHLRGLRLKPRILLDWAQGMARRVRRLPSAPATATRMHLDRWPSLDITLYCGLQRGGEDAERPGEGVLVVVGTAVTRAAAVLLQAGVAGLVTGVQPRVQPRHGHIGQQLSARPRHGTDTDTGSSLPARVFILASRRAPLPQYCDSHWPGEIESV